MVMIRLTYYFDITGYINVLMDVRINVPIMSELSIVSLVSNNNETGETNFETSQNPSPI